MQSTLLELDHKQRGNHPLAPHIQLTRDRNGLQQSILKVPLWLKSGDGEAAPNVPSNDDEYVNQFIEPADVRNEAVIGSYAQSTNSYQRSHSNLQMTSACEFTAQSLSDPPNGGSTPVVKSIEEIDRGVADGGSNQHDSDFGKSSD